MDHQPNDEKQLILTPEPQALAKFILSLLEQPRRIEQNFPNKIFVIDYTWCRNLIEICEHRMDQHKYSICSFSCDIVYKDGRVDSISSKEAFYAYLDSKQCLSVGVDMSISFLVQFGTKQEQEKQDFRIQVFSDESYKVLIKPIHNSEHRSVISYSIAFSNLTWGEDMSRHINTHIYTVLKDGIFTNLLIAISSVASRLYTISIFPIALLVGIFIMDKNLSEATKVTKRHVEEFNTLLNENTIEAISKKLNIIMTQVGYMGFRSGFGWLGLILICGTIINIVPYIAKVLTKRFCVSFVIFNDYTKTVSTDHIATNGKLKWVVISAVVDTVFEGKRKRSPATRTRAVLIAGMMMLERETALKPAR
jgi:hypothetical protein